MSERKHFQEIGIIPSERTAITVNRVLDAQHPPSHIVAAAALHLGGGVSETTVISDLLGKEGYDTALYDRLFRSEGITQVLTDPGKKVNVQQARFTSFARDIRYPELCALTMHWMAANKQTNPSLFSGSGSTSEKCGLLTAAYLASERDLPEKTIKLLQMTSEAALQIHQQKPRNKRANVRDSLCNDGLATKNGTSGVVLTTLGQSYVEEVLIPYSMLLVNKADFMTSPAMQTARERVLLEENTREKDLSVYGSRLRSFSNAWSRA